MSGRPDACFFTVLIALLTRLIANFDRVASVEASPGTSIFEQVD
jgi:hypothetical protein